MKLPPRANKATKAQMYALLVRALPHIVKRRDWLLAAHIRDITGPVQPKRP